jgi:hypothetical protein
MVIEASERQVVLALQASSVVVNAIVSFIEPAEMNRSEEHVPGTLGAPNNLRCYRSRVRTIAKPSWGLPRGPSRTVAVPGMAIETPQVLALAAFQCL